MITLYAAPTSNGLRARIAMEECGIGYTLNKMDLMAGDQKTADYMALNPQGIIPTLVHEDTPDGRIVLTQSAAIMRYASQLAGGKYAPSEGAAGAAFEQAFSYVTTDMGAILQTIFTVARSEHANDPSRGIFEDKYKQYLKVWDEKLANQKYLAGDEPTLADFALTAVHHRCMTVTPELGEGCPNIDRWLDEMLARPAVQTALDFS